MKLIKGALLGSDYFTQDVTLQTSISYFPLLLMFIQTVHFFLRKKHELSHVIPKYTVAIMSHIPI